MNNNDPIVEEGNVIKSDTKDVKKDFHHYNEKSICERYHINLIAIALFFIIVICITIILCVTIGPRKDKEILTFDDVSGKLNPKGYSGSWISDDELLEYDSHGNLVIRKVMSEEYTTIVSEETIKKYSILPQRFSLSNDRNYLLFYSDITWLYRHSYLAKYKILEINNIENVITLGPEFRDVDLRYAKWGPTKPELIFVYNNTIYYKNTPQSDSIEIIKNENDDIFNGIPDWVYEEEILSSNNAIWWAPKEDKFCYATFDVTNVDLFEYEWYGSYKNNDNNTIDAYPKTEKIRYPKPGHKNPVVKLFVYDIKSGEIQDIQPPKKMIDAEQYYFTTITWTDTMKLSIIWLMRDQSQAIISICDNSEDSKLWKCDENYYQNSTAWVDMYDPPLFSRGEYFIILPKPEESSGHFRHIMKVTIQDNARNFTTQGNFDTTQILAIRGDHLYYISTLMGKPGERHIFKVDITSGVSNQITFDNCLYNSATFSRDATYYIHRCNGPDIPKIALRSTEDNSIIKLLEPNDKLRNDLENKSLPKIKRFTISLNDYNVPVMLYLPPNLNEDKSIKYPLLIQVYGGPGSQLVNERFQINWGHYLASNKSIIYAFIDGRGGGFNGDKYLHELYLKLGTVEVEDQIAGAKYLRNSLPYIDKEKIAIWGWSYGGFATAMALANDTDNVFSCGISVAPVTSWLLYDSVYTERYMAMPKDNPQGYNRDVLNNVDNFRTKKFLLIHGSADDNVHFQQSMLLIKALTLKNIEFKSQVYVDENHGLSGVRPHHYKLMEEFLDQCFH